MMTKKVPELAQVAPIARVVTVESVCWREIVAKRCVELSSMGPAQLETSYQATGLRDLPADQIVVIAQFMFSAHAKDEGTKLAEINATLSLRYSLAEGAVKDFDADAVQAFAETNGVYNAWPYWREMLQSTAARIGLHDVVAPVFRLVQVDQKETTEQTEK